MLATIKRLLFEPPRPVREDSSFMPYVCVDGPLVGDTLWLSEPKSSVMRIGQQRGRYVGQPWDRGDYFGLTNRLHWEKIE